MANNKQTPSGGAHTPTLPTVKVRAPFLRPVANNRMAVPSPSPQTMDTRPCGNQSTPDRPTPCGNQSTPDNPVPCGYNESGRRRRPVEQF